MTKAWLVTLAHDLLQKRHITENEAKKLREIADRLEPPEPRAWGVWSTVPGGPYGGWWVSDGEDAGNARVFYSPRAAKAWSKGYAHSEVREIGPDGEPVEAE